MCAHAHAGPFSEPQIAIWGSSEARIVELSNFMHKNCHYIGFLYNRTPLGRFGRVTLGLAWYCDTKKVVEGKRRLSVWGAGAWELNVISQGHMGRTIGGEREKVRVHTRLLTPLGSADFIDV